MTIKWVKSDPLVMNGEPFCYATRLTVRNILEMRVSGLAPEEMMGQHPELRRIGIAEAFRYAGEHRERYADFFEPDGTLRGPGFEPGVAAAFPQPLREATGLVVSGPAGGQPGGGTPPAGEPAAGQRPAAGFEPGRTGEAPAGP